MAVADLAAMITQVGFPIAMCVIMMFYIKELLKAHADEMEGIRTAITELNQSVLKVMMMLGGDNDGK